MSLVSPGYNMAHRFVSMSVTYVCSRSVGPPDRRLYPIHLQTDSVEELALHRDDVHGGKEDPRRHHLDIQLADEEGFVYKTIGMCLMDAIIQPVEGTVTHFLDVEQPGEGKRRRL